jgi:hypothetical protein
MYTKSELQCSPQETSKMTVEKQMPDSFLTLQKIHFVFPVQFLLMRLSFASVTPLFKYHKKILILSGSLSFHMSLFSQTLPVVKALYITLTVNKPF